GAIACCKVRGGGTDGVENERAARPPSLPIRSKHEMVDDQLTASAEEICQGAFPLGSIKDVILVHANPWQFASLRIYSVPGVCEFFLLQQQSFAQGKPFVPRNDQMAGVGISGIGNGRLDFHDV